MSLENDWRRTGQEGYLKNVTLIWKEYSKYRAGWDHDHCEFCGAKFMEKKGKDILTEGYVTDDNYHWVCKQCFTDFKSEFGWEVKGGPA